ncbi:MAG TPA: type II secretion system minor pseudopilin GspH [Gammaproteobacteria bacterium]|nr:type II secretion system minor pseudopilin GspH [Gammaproteobacteria bacterium]
MRGARRCLDRGQRGFTLIEILVVMVIIAIITTVAVLSLGNGNRDRLVKQEAQRLTAVLDVASQDAVIQSTQYGLRVAGDGYGFLELHDQKWRPVSGEAALAHHSLPGGVRMDLSVEGLAAKLTSGEQDRRPQVLVLSSGEMTPFQVRISAQGTPAVAIVKGSPTGKIETRMEGQ